MATVRPRSDPASKVRAMIRRSAGPLRIAVAGGAGSQALVEAEIDQNARRVGGKLEPGSSLLEPHRLFQHADA
mgnify:CR=1 FL=1